MSIYRTPDAGVAAVIRQAPGFAGEDVRTGTELITRIEPFTGGGFHGRFQIPGEPPVEVRLVLNTPDQLNIVTRDARARGNIMRWHRIPIQRP